MSTDQIAQYVAYVVVMMIGGGGEYLHLLPSGTLNSIFLLVAGHVFGTIPTVNTLAKAIGNMPGTTPPPQPPIIPNPPGVVS